MEDLRLDTIPKSLLSRILLQLHTLPPREIADFIHILSAGLNKYGHTGNINAFLDYCSTRSVKQDESWLWKYYEIKHDSDWDKANSKKSKELVGMRFLLSSETARNKIQLTRYGRDTIIDPKCAYLYGDRILPVNEILNDTMTYLRQENKVDDIITQLIGLRLAKYNQDVVEFKEKLSEFDETTYHLMGALLARYDSSSTHGSSPNAWCLYLRDYLNSDGTQWRVLLENQEFVVTSEQALSDIRGIKDEMSRQEPTAFSKDYRPVYLFYINQDTLIPPPQQQQEHITLDDYTFEEEEEEEEYCMRCGIKDIVDDINDMFFCESCNKGVHQLCENPPILAFEKDVDPWYCRSCCITKGIPIPIPPPLVESIKRKRQDIEEDSLTLKK